MAFRAAPEPDADPSDSAMLTSPPQPPLSKPLPSWAPVFGGTSLAVGLLSIAWFLFARPEYGDLGSRIAYFQQMFATDRWARGGWMSVEDGVAGLIDFSTCRVFFAFVVDACLYSVWQAMLLQDAPATQRFVPFFGLAAYLVSGTREERK